MGLEGGSVEFELSASPAACFAAVADFESYPEWQGPIEECRVLERDASGRASVVESIVDVKLKKIRYVLAYTYEEPRLVEWSFVEGDPKDVQGAFVFEDDGSGGTRGEYRQAIDPGGMTRFLPGPAKNALLKLLLDDAVKDLRKRVES